MHEETSIPAQEKLNPPIVKQKRSKKIPVATTLVGETPKRKSRQNLVIQEETPVRRSPHMRGQVSKESTSPNLPTKESPAHIVSYNSPPHIENPNIPETTNEECKVEANKNQSEATTGQLDTSTGENERVSKPIYSNTSLIPYTSTWLIDLVG